MAALAVIIEAVLRVLLPWLIEQSKATAVDADSDVATREKLRAKIRTHWGAGIILLALLAGGCGGRTVYVPDGAPVRLRETVRGAKVWVKGSSGEVIAGEVDLPEGWYALPLDSEE